jgi:hypothetical protein
MTAQARVKRGIWQNLLGRNGLKAPDVGTCGDGTFTADSGTRLRC